MNRLFAGILFFILSFASIGIASAVTLFSDDFENGNLNAWNNFAVTGANSWNITSLTPLGNWAARANPLNNSVEPASVLQRNVSTDGYGNITFSYWRRLAGLDVSDEFKVKYFNGA